MVAYHARRKLPWWAIALVALACGGLLYLVLSSGSGEQPEQATSRPETPQGATADPQPNGEGSAGEPEPTSTVGARFAQPATGERLEFRVLSLGDDPNRCRAASLRAGDDVRTAYHHDCKGREPELSFFLVRLTGLADDPVPVERSGFELVTRAGDVLTPLDLDDVDERFPEETALGPGVSRKGWVVFELPGTPAAVRYTDGQQVLTVRFSDTWL